MSESTQNNLFGSVKWVMLGNILPKLVSPIITIILTKFLSPDLFGTFAIGLIIISFSEIVQGFGTVDYIIKSHKISIITLNTAFWINICFSIFIYLSIFLFTPYIAGYYNSDILLNLIPILAIVIVINSVGYVHYSLLVKEFEFKKLFYRQLAPAISAALIALPLAFYGFGVYSLVYAAVFQAVLSNTLYIVFSPWRPSFSFSIKSSIEIFLFGYWMVIEKLSEYVYLTYDRIWISIIGDLHFLGLYNLASQFINIVIQIARAPLQNLMFPVLSKFQNKYKFQNRVFTYFLYRVSFLNIYALLLLIPGSIFITNQFLGPEWQDIPTIVIILLLGQALFKSVGPQRELLKIRNKVRIYSISLFVILFIALIFYIAFGKNISWIGFCSVKSTIDIIGFVIQIFIIRKYLKIELKNIIKHIFTLYIILIIFASYFLSYFALVNVDFINPLISFGLILMMLVGFPLYYKLVFPAEFRKLKVDTLSVLNLGKIKK